MFKREAGASSDALGLYRTFDNDKRRNRNGVPRDDWAPHQDRTWDWRWTCFQSKIFRMDDKARCPVEAFKRYTSKPPEETGTDPYFYLAVNYSFESTGNWFKKSRSGERSLGDMMKDAAQIANITGKRVANHSARKTAVKRLWRRLSPYICGSVDWTCVNI